MVRNIQKNLQRFIFLISLLVIISPVHAAIENKGTSVAGVSAGFVARGVAGAAFLGMCTNILYDMSWHKTYVQQSTVLYSQLEQSCNFVLHNLQQEKTEQFFNARNINSIVGLMRNLRNSYDSKIKIWNWGADQQQAYAMAQVLFLTFLYAQVVPITDMKKKVRYLSSLFDTRHYRSLLEFVEITASLCTMTKEQIDLLYPSNVQGFVKGMLPAIIDLILDVVLSDEYLDQMRYQELATMVTCHSSCR